MKYLFHSIAIFVILIAVIAVFFTSKSPYYSGVVDVSWPNCHAKVSGNFGIVGVTGGLSFQPNPCLSAEASRFNHLALYMNTGYPGDASTRRFPNYPGRCTNNDETCLAYNYGYNAADYAINYARSQFIYSRLWWLDVETENSWADNISVNRSALQGSIDAIHKKIFWPILGIYSNSTQWNEIVGAWHNRLPNWIATGATNQAASKTFCKENNFTDGQTLLSQYTSMLDHDYKCI